MKRLLFLPLAGLAFAAACSDGADSPLAPRGGAVLDSSDPVVDVPAGPDVAATFISFAQFNNPTCSDLMPGTIELKKDGPAAGNVVTDGVATVWITRQTGSVLDWHSSVPIDGVLLKSGSDGHNFYNYVQMGGPGPQEADDGLTTPTGQNISHVSFCYVPRLDVSKTASTTYSRDYDWDLDKTGSETSLTLSQSQVSFLVDYEVTVSVAGFADSDWAVSGSITIHNPHAQAAIISSVSDEITGGISATPDCGVSFPYALPAGQTLVCSYSSPLPDASARTNTATVVTTGVIQGGSGQAAVTFGDPSGLVDECVDVTDDKGVPGSPQALGTVCVGDAPRTFTYSMNVVELAEECEVTDVTNTAIADQDTGTDPSDTHTVVVTINCPEGCTLTQGYWKTHADPTRKQFDATWNLLPQGPNTVFYLSGQSWLAVFNTPVAGNQYYSLAHQFMAARLNILAGANGTAVASHMSQAHALFSTYSPTQVGAMKSNNPVRQQFVALAAALDAFNNGVTGPGHCSEQ